MTSGREPRVLLVEDDALIAGYVQMALAHLPIELEVAATLQDGVAAWRREPPDLLLTDVSLPDGEGHALLPLAAAARPARRVVVFSADVSPPVRERARRGGAWRVLAKPVSLGLLTRTVCEALDLPDEAATRPAPLDDAPDARAPYLEPGDPLLPHDDFAPSERAALIEPDFAGRRELYDAFRASCLPQFVHDIAGGDAACVAGDRAALRRLGHNLKSVLALLGEDALSELARRLDTAAQAEGDTTAAWQALRSGLRRTFALPVAP